MCIIIAQNTNFFCIKICVLNSAADPLAIDKNLANSFSVRSEPSAIFDAIDTADLCI